MATSTSARQTSTTEPTSGGLLARARNAIPNYRELTAALAGIADRAAAARAALQPEQSVIDVALPAVLAGNIPDDLGAQIVGLRRTNEQAMAEQGALALLQKRLRTELRDAQVSGVDAGLHVLADELESILTEARAVLDPLGDVDSADAAIDAGRTQEWTRANALAAQYVQLRRAQASLVTAAVEPVDNTALASTSATTTRRSAQTLVDSYGYVRDFDTWRQRPDPVASDPARGQLGERTVGSSNAPDVLPWLTGDSLTDLRFVCHADVEPWVPTLGELTAARRADQRRDHDDTEPRSLELSPGRANLLTERGHLTTR